MSRDTDRILIGIDGNCAYALLGVDIDSGQAEFVEIATEARRWSPLWMKIAVARGYDAYRTLCNRLNKRYEYQFDENLQPPQDNDENEDGH